MKYKRIHIGKIIERELEKSGQSEVAFAAALGVNPCDLKSEIFSQESINTELLMLIGEFLDYDFFSFFLAENGVSFRQNVTDHASGTMDGNIYNLTTLGCCPTSSSVNADIKEGIDQTSINNTEIHGLRARLKDQQDIIDLLREAVKSKDELLRFYRSKSMGE